MQAFGAVLSLFHVFAATQAGSFLALELDDCFERVSIGKRLNDSDVTKTISAVNIKQCSIECERMLCNAYSYGVNGNGNGTCLIGLDLPKSGPYDDPEYDLFMKILQCRDRTMCYVKIVGGRRLSDKYIQKILPVASKGDCEIFCEFEKEFRCEGFNFRYDLKLDAYSSCQLTGASSAKLDLSLDFHSDLEYDFYEKNVNASPSCRYLELPGPYGQRRNWDLAGNEQDLGAPWKDFDPLWYQRNEIAYGNDKVFYDRGAVRPTTSGFLGYDGVTSLPVNPFNTVRFPYDGVGQTFSTAGRLPVSPNECFIKARTGHHLQRNNIIKSMGAPSLFGCETICANEQTFTCNVFSYRYSITSLADNCHLGDKMLRQLDIFQDLVPDRDCDVFARNELSQPGCQPIRNWDTDCFERIKSGLTFHLSIVKFSVQTENLHECELICLHVKHFTCRVFSFRRGPSVIGKWSDNCYLTDYPVIDIDPTKHFVEDSGCDIYNRGSYGRGCELDKILPTGDGWPPVTGNDLTPTVLTTYRPEYGVPPPLAPSPSLYGPKYGPPDPPPIQFFPVTPSELPLPLPSPSPSPLPPQYYPVGPPSSLSPPSSYFPVTPTVFGTSTKRTGTFVPSQPPTTFFQIPGEYTPVSIKPLNKESGLDGVFKGWYGPYGPNPTQVPTIFGTPKKLCYINFGSTARLLPPAVKKSMTVVSEYQCKLECTSARENQYFRCATLSYFGGYCEMSDIQLRDLKPNQDFTLDQRFLLYTWDFDEVQCFGSPGAKFPPTSSSFPGGLEWTWMRFTVNGQPCKSGSYCTQNVNMDIWSCPVDQGDWDYCCRPDHKCGYSEGISYPWCYVGKSSEQWRPCSDQYYPSVGGSAQSWPVTYIHHTGPPGTPVAGTPFPPGSTPIPLPPLLPSSPSVRENINKTTLTAVQHEQSLVDQFLSIFKSSSSGAAASTVSPTVVTVTEANGDKTAAAATATPDPVPGFRVVDVTDKPSRNGALDNRVVTLYASSNGNRFSERWFAKRKPYV